MKKAPVAEDIFMVLSDPITIKMLKLVSTGFRARGGLYSKLRITKKQYNTRLHRLVAIGLIHKRNAVYTLTALGQIVYKTILKMGEESITNYWKLKAIDSFEKDMPLEEKHNMIDAMLDGTLIRDTLAKYASLFLIVNWQTDFCQPILALSDVRPSSSKSQHLTLPSFSSFD